LIDRGAGIFFSKRRLRRRKFALKWGRSVETPLRWTRPFRTSRLENEG
jgi:hypothetical protein